MTNDDDVGNQKDPEEIDVTETIPIKVEMEEEDDSAEDMAYYQQYQYDDDSEH